MLHGAAEPIANVVQSLSHAGAGAASCSQAKTRCAAQQWVQLWTQVMTDINSDGVTANHVIVDILNEPDSRMFLCAPPACSGSWQQPAAALQALA